MQYINQSSNQDQNTNQGPGENLAFNDDPVPAWNIPVAKGDEKPTLIMSSFQLPVVLDFGSLNIVATGKLLSSKEPVTVNIMMHKLEVDASHQSFTGKTLTEDVVLTRGEGDFEAQTKATSNSEFGVWNIMKFKHVLNSIESERQT